MLGQAVHSLLPEVARTSPRRVAQGVTATDLALRITDPLRANQTITISRQRVFVSPDCRARQAEPLGTTALPISLLASLSHKTELATPTQTIQSAAVSPTVPKALWRNRA